MKGFTTAIVSLLLWNGSATLLVADPVDVYVTAENVAGQPTSTDETFCFRAAPDLDQSLLKACKQSAAYKGLLTAEAGNCSSIAIGVKVAPMSDGFSKTMTFTVTDRKGIAVHRIITVLQSAHPEINRATVVASCRAAFANFPDVRKSRHYEAETGETSDLTYRQISTGKTYNMKFRAPTLSFLGDYGAGYVGVVGSKSLGPRISTFGSYDFGVAGTLGNFAGMGQVSHLLGGFEFLLGESVFVTVGGGLRYLKVGTIGTHKNPNYTSYDEEYSAYTTAWLKATSLGLSLSAGRMFAFDKIAIGFSLFDVFLPVYTLHAKGNLTDDSDLQSPQDPDAKARRAASGSEFSLPRIIVAYPF